jgi:hypothetical protein
VAGLLALISTILLGILALREEYALPLRRAQELLDMKKKKGENYTADQLNSGIGVSPGASHGIYIHLLVLSFSASFFFLFIFAAVNIL